MQSFKILVTSGSLLAIFACGSGNGDGADAGVNNLTNSQSAPNNSQGAPNNSQGAPNDSQGAPNNSQGAPNYSQPWPPNLPSSQPTTVVVVVETDGGIDNQPPATGCSNTVTCTGCASTCDLCNCAAAIGATAPSVCANYCPAPAGADCTTGGACKGCANLCDLCTCQGGTQTECSALSSGC